MPTVDKREELEAMLCKHGADPAHAPCVLCTVVG